MIHWHLVNVLVVAMAVGVMSVTMIMMTVVVLLTMMVVMVVVVVLPTTLAVCPRSTL